MTAPVNPEGQTAREHELKCWPEFFEKLLSREKTFEARKDDRGFRAGDRLRLREWGEKRGYTGREILADVTYLMTGFGVAPSYVVMAIRPLAQPSEGQTAQELRQRAEALWIALNRPAMTSNKGIDLIVRALASTPSQIQTQSTKEQNNGAGRIHEGGGEGHGGGSQGGVRGASESEEDGLRRPHERHLPVPDGSGERRALGAAEEEVAPPPAKQTEQKIASAEGAASQLGAAPATLEVTVFSGVEGPCIAIGGYRVAGPKPWGGGKVLHHWKASVADLQKAVPLAPAQPDARDAEIARLTKELEEARAQGLLDGQDLVNLRQQVEDCIGNAQTDADGDGWITAYHFNTGSIHRLLAMARDIRPHQGRVFRTVGPPALAPPEPKAETPAETAGQKEGLTALQSRVAAWVRLAFTEEALTDRWERAARVVEEAVELGQAEGLDHEDVYRIWQRVYSRGAGDVEQEAGGVMVCLLAWAAGRQTSLAACAVREIERIEQPATIEKIRRKQAEKAKAGTGHDFAPPSLDPAQPSQDVAGTSGESLAGLSKEGSET